jgi:hypothetical protein
MRFQKTGAIFAATGPLNENIFPPPPLGGV